jgi:hypothetical protein
LILKTIVPIDDLRGDRSAGGLATTHACKQHDGVFFDLLSSAAAVSTLPSSQFPVDERKIEFDARGHSLDQRQRTGAV